MKKFLLLIHWNKLKQRDVSIEKSVKGHTSQEIFMLEGGALELKTS